METFNWMQYFFWHVIIHISLSPRVSNYSTCKQGSAMMSHCVSLLTESSSPWPSASLALSTAETHKCWGQQWLCNSREDERITWYTVQLWTLKIKAQLFCNSQPQVTYHYWSNWESLLACQLLLFIMYQSIIRPLISAIVGQGGDLTN